LLKFAKFFHRRLIAAVFQLVSSDILRVKKSRLCCLVSIFCDLLLRFFFLCFHGAKLPASDLDLQAQYP
jgi:hypothetical protein